jgi:hypothetical protein
VALATAANGSKEPTFTDAARCTDVWFTRKGVYMVHGDLIRIADLKINRHGNQLLWINDE